MTRYPKLKTILEPLRARVGIGTQTELAVLLGSTQQTVSRWEKGESRPREKDVPRLAALLKVEAKELLEAAGYGVALAVVQAFDKPFPVHGLTPDSFERFCLYLLQKLYRDQHAQVHRAGESGHTQGGIDISARGDGWLHTFQCKRVMEFGPGKVAKAVAAQSVSAERKVLLLSCVASPQAREEVSRHKGWEIWDKEDLSATVRALPIRDQRELVQVFFRSQRFELLGELDDSPWLTVAEFFAPFMERAKLFHHKWELVGRVEEVRDLQAALESEAVRVTMLVGAPGGGKSRLLKHVLEDYAGRHSSTAVWVLSPTDVATPKSLEELGPGAKLLVVDDAHDRDDLEVLMRHCTQDKACRLLFALRPYGDQLIRNQAASIALSGDEVRVVSLRKPTLSDTTALAAEALAASNGPADAAKDLAYLTHPNALATVLGAQIVAKEGIHPFWMNSDDEFQTLVLSRFQDLMTDGVAIGQDVDRLQGVLRIVSLVQPVLPDEPALLDLIEAIEGVRKHDASRLLRTLVDAGVLFKRGLRYRLSPDLLADSIIERYCFHGAGAAEYIQKVFESVEKHGTFLKSLLLNLGRLDWRRRDGDTKDSNVLSGVWSKLRWENEYLSPHLDAAASVAYYQPNQALDFAAEQIRLGHGNNERVCAAIKNAAHNLEYLDRACMLLWQAGTSAPNDRDKQPQGIRVLRELASYEPNKPTEFISKVADFAIESLQSRVALEGGYAPFEVLDGALTTEGHTSWAANSRTITLSAYAVPQAEVRDVRARVVSALFKCLVSEPTRRAFQAAKALQNALSFPSGILGLKIEESDRSAWLATHAQTLNELVRILSEHHLPASVLVRVAQSVHWHAFYGEPETAEPARRVLEHLTRDVETRLVRSLMDGWGSETWSLDEETYERSAHEADTKALLEELSEAFPDPQKLRAFVGAILQDLQSVGALDNGSEHLFIHQLIRARLDFAEEVVLLPAGEEIGPLSSYGGTALGALLNARTAESQRIVRDLMQSGSTAAIQTVAESYVRFEARDGYTAADLTIIRAICHSSDALVARLAAPLISTVARVDPRLAADLLSLVDFRVLGQRVRELYMLVGEKRGIPEEVLSDAQVRHLVASLESVEDFDDHWVWAFLKRATRRVPEAVVGLVQRRMDAATATENWRLSRFSLRHRHGNGLELLKIDGGQRYLVDLLDWGLSRIEANSLDFHFGETVVGLCGKFDNAALSLLVTWMGSGGTYEHVRLISAVVREMPNTLIYDHASFVQEVLRAAQVVGGKAVETMQSAIYAASVSGMRGGTPGEPFPFDLRMEKCAKEVLVTLSRFDPAYQLYTWLLAHAQEDIARQLRQKEAMDAEDEERN